MRELGQEEGKAEWMKHDKRKMKEHGMKGIDEINKKRKVRERGTYRRTRRIKS